MKRIFNGNARALAMDNARRAPHCNLYGDLIAAKVQGRATRTGDLLLESCTNQYQKRLILFFIHNI